jgi:UDP-N-acetylmuramate dehydrogenase
LPSPDCGFAPSPSVPLAPLTTLGIGGRARWFARATTLEEVAAAEAWCAERDIGLFVLGGGSNLVVADTGLDGLVLQIGVGGLTFTRRDADTLVTVGAGEPWDRVVAAVVDRGLAGLECLSGIPGSAGGTPVQNVGAYGQEVGDSIEHVVAFDRTTSGVATLSNAACGFAYRMSRFKRDDPGRFIVCEVGFALRPGPPSITYPDVVKYFERQAIAHPALADARAAILEIRRRKGMVIDPLDPDTRSVGSFFMNPVVSAGRRAEIAAATPDGQAPGFILPDGAVKIPAAWLIEQAGFAKGFSAGGAGLSTKHPLAIVNRGGATAADVVALAVRIKRQVVDRFGVALRPEPVFAGFGENADVQYLQQG